MAEKITRKELDELIEKRVEARLAAHAAEKGGGAPDDAAIAAEAAATAEAEAKAKKEAEATAITTRTKPPETGDRFADPANKSKVPAVNGPAKTAIAPDAAVDTRLEVSLVGRTRWAPYYMAEQRSLGGPSCFVRKFGAGDSELIDVVCRMHKMLFAGDNSGVARLLQERALSEGVGAEGGFLVPEEFAAEVLMKEGELTPLATSEFVTVVPMGSDVKKMPVEDTRPNVAAFPENTSGEGGTDPSVGQVELIARKQGRVLPISVDLIEDSSVAMLEYLRDVYAKIMAERKSFLFTEGTGGGEPEGIRNATGVTTEAFTGVQTNSNDVLDWIERIYWGPKAQYRQRAIWFASALMLQTLSQIKSGQGLPILSQITDQPFQRLKGRPIFENNDILDNLGGGTNESELIFGDFKKYLVGDRNQMRVSTDAGGKYFAADQVAMKVTEKYDGKIGQAEAFIRGTGKTVS